MPGSIEGASLELESPLIKGVLQGEVFVAAQDENPFGSVFAAYVVVNDPTTGVLLKIPGSSRQPKHWPDHRGVRGKPAATIQ